MTPDEVSLRDHFHSLIAEMDRRYEVIDKANKEALRVALATVDKAADRLETTNKEQRVAANEWRATLNDVVTRMLTRQEYDREHKALGQHVDDRLIAVEAQIADLRESRSASSSRELTVDKLTEQHRVTQRFVIGLAITIALSILWNVIQQVRG